MTERLDSRTEALSETLFRSSKWEETKATVISCTYHYARLRDLSEDFQDDSFFLVSFSYTVKGQSIVDEYRRSSALEVGHEIVILYNPSNPSQNNLSGAETSLAFRRITWLIGIILAAILIYLTAHFDLDLGDH